MLKAAAAYFGVLFGVGFALGPIRVLLLEPRTGTRTAELIEAPVMLAVIVWAGRKVGRRWCAGMGPAARLAVGLIAAGLVLAADLAVGVGLRGLSAVEVFTGRDPVAGPIYYALVALAAVAPWALGRPPPPAGASRPDSTDAG